MKSLWKLHSICTANSICWYICVLIQCQWNWETDWYLFSVRRIKWYLCLVCVWSEWSKKWLYDRQQSVWTTFQAEKCQQRQALVENFHLFWWKMLHLCRNQSIILVVKVRVIGNLSFAILFIVSECWHEFVRFAVRATPALNPDSNFKFGWVGAWRVSNVLDQTQKQCQYPIFRS